MRSSPGARNGEGSLADSWFNAACAAMASIFFAHGVELGVAVSDLVAALDVVGLVVAEGDAEGAVLPRQQHDGKVQPHLLIALQECGAVGWEVGHHGRRGAELQAYAGGGHGVVNHNLSYVDEHLSAQ